MFTCIYVLCHPERVPSRSAVSILICDAHLDLRHPKIWSANIIRRKYTTALVYKYGSYVLVRVASVQHKFNTSSIQVQEVRYEVDATQAPLLF
jgi:hypothetical protein